ncbi:hypothetical protein B5F41_10825 [Gordonibacter sp. An232A]|nr:hypothetical protein B5F41_10825 [Gordonibacter sp. An232A]
MAEEETRSLGQRAAGAAKWSILTQVVAKLISPITTMVLARLLTPDAFGVVATATMVTSLAGMISDAGFQKYLVQHEFKDEGERSLSACVAFWTNLAISLLIVGIVALFNGPLAAAVGNPGLGIVLIVASLSLPITSLVSVQTVLYQRALDFKTLFSAQVGSSALILFVSVPLALLGFDYWSMIIGTVSSNVLLAIWLTVKSEWKPQFRYSLAELRRMFSFGVWVLLESLATWVNTWAGTFVLGALMSSYYVGLYKTSTNVCSSIMSVFTSAVIPIAFSALSRVQGDDERFESILLKMQRYLAMCIIPVSFCCLVYRHALTLLLLGGQWDETELFIGLWMFTGCINVVFGYMCSEAYRAKGCPSLCVFVQVAYLVPFLPCLYVSATLGYGYVSVVMPALRIVLAVINLTVLKMAFGVSPWRMIMNVWRVFVQSLIAVLPGIVVTALTDSLAVEVATAAFSVLIYLVLLFKCRGTREEACSLLDRLGLRKLVLAVRRALRRG